MTKNFKEYDEEDYSIPSILDDAIEKDENIISSGNDENDADVDFSSSVSSSDLLRDIDGNSSPSAEIDMFQMMDIKSRDLDFQFKNGCATCVLALDDPSIHDVYRRSGNVKEVERHMQEKYGDIQKVPSYDSIANHINTHFWPTEVSRNEDIIKYKSKVKDKTTELTTLTRESEIMQMKAMTWVILEDLASTNKNSKSYLEAIKIYNQTAKTALQLAEHELKLLGADGNTTPEVMEKRIRNYLTQLISTAKEEDPDMAKKLVGLLHKVNLPTE